MTEPGALHQVPNIGANYAIAINMLYGSSPTFPNGYRFCQKICDPNALTAAHLGLCEDGTPLAHVQPNQRTRRLGGKVSAVRPKIVPLKRSALPFVAQKKPQVTPQMGRLLQAVGGKEAFHRLCTL